MLATPTWSTTSSASLRPGRRDRGRHDRGAGARRRGMMYGFALRLWRGTALGRLSPLQGSTVVSRLVILAAIALAAPLTPDGPPSGGRRGGERSTRRRRACSFRASRCRDCRPRRGPPSKVISPDIASTLPPTWLSDMMMSQGASMRIGQLRISAYPDRIFRAARRRRGRADGRGNVGDDLLGSMRPRATALAVAAA